MRRTALVVDDDADVRAIISLSMSAVGGWLVVEAEGGLEAVDIAVRKGPDVVILDVAMPGVDGIATLHLLTQNLLTSGVPVVLLTASQRIGVQAWDGLDVCGVLDKPFDPMRLPAQIDALLAQRARSAGAGHHGPSPTAELPRIDDDPVAGNGP